MLPHCSAAARTRFAERRCPSACHMREPATTYTIASDKIPARDVRLRRARARPGSCAAQRAHVAVQRDDQSASSSNDPVTACGRCSNRATQTHHGFTCEAVMYLRLSVRRSGAARS